MGRSGQFRRHAFLWRVVVSGGLVAGRGAAGAGPLAGWPGWTRPVDGAVSRAFEEPAGPYGPGHRGVDLVAPPGTPVRAAGDGTVSFAGDVAGSMHVVVAHEGGLRTS